MATPRPENVGILAAEVYFPTSYVSQKDLEVHDGVSEGKYTIGLGQDKLGFCTDVEDVISMSLTVVTNLLEKYAVSADMIGRLEVGSETVIDKSKSIKSSLMVLFGENGDIEGVDSTNACYGGTAALLNCINWVESSAWDGRFGIVVAADVAVYAEGPARPTGGAGAVALLIGPNAPIIMERSFTASYMEHVYDFYKPELASEYPTVDGKLSQSCYLKALDMCYRKYAANFQSREGKQFSLSQADYVVCHSPYNKLVQKSFARLVYNDYLRSSSLVSEEVAAQFQPFANISHDESLLSRDLDRVASTVSKRQYQVMVGPATKIPKETGNMYCASVWAGLCSLISTASDALVGKRVLLFSYGSGLASSMMSFRIQQLGQSPFSLKAIREAINLQKKFDSRVQVTPEKFVEFMHLAETRYGAKDFTPSSSVNDLRPGTYYLTNVDDKYRRFYNRKQTADPLPTLEQLNLKWEALRF